MSIIDEWLILCKAQVEGSGFNKLNKQIQTTKNSLFDAKNLFRAFIGYDVYSGIKQFATSLVQSTRDLGAMTSRFYAITKSEKLANEELQWTFDLAQRTAMGLKSTADSYSIFYAATQKGLGTEGARQVFQDWTEVSRVLHLSEYQFERVTYALREMASKGAIYSQDLRMQIGTHVPNAIGLAQKAVNELGISGNDWFEKFQKQAKGNQQLINQFIVLFSKYAKEAYASPEALAKALEQPDAQIQRLYNNWQKFIYSLGGGQFSKDLVSFLKIINPLLEKITNHSSEIYGLMKALVFILGMLALDKLVVGLFKTHVRILRIAKTLKQVSGFASKMVALLQRLGYGSSFIPLILKLLSNPTILAGTLILACIPLLIWFIRKFFPNVWIALSAMLNNVKMFFVNLFDDIIYRLKSILGIETSNTLKKADAEILAQRQKQREQGGLFRGGMSAREFFDELLHIPTANKLTTSELRTLSMPGLPGAGVMPGAVSAGLVQKHQIDINVNGNNVAQEVGAENLQDAIDRNQGGILGALKRAIIRN